MYTAKPLTATTMVTIREILQIGHDHFKLVPSREMQERSNILRTVFNDSNVDKTSSLDFFGIETFILYEISKTAIVLSGDCCYKIISYVVVL